MSFHGQLHEIFSGYTAEDWQIQSVSDDAHSIFCAAIDALFDTDSALLDIKRRTEAPPLLSAMGFIVAIRTQQKSYFEISKVLGKEVSLYSTSEGEQLRQLCSRILHPVRNNKGVSTFFPVGSATKDGFTIAYYGDPTSKGQFVDYDDTLKAHWSVIASVKETILLQAEEVEFTMHQRHPRRVWVMGTELERGEDRFREFKQKCSEMQRPVAQVNLNPS